MNDQQRAAMQMALEALHNTSNALLFVSADGYSVSKMASDAYDDAEKAITALREALAQPLLEPEGRCKYCLTYNGHQDGCLHGAQPKDHSEQHLNMVQGEWVDLTDDEVWKIYGITGLGNGMALRFARAVIAKFKEKNTPPVVPQEPVAWMYKFKTEDPILCKVKRDWADNHSQWKETPLYTTPPSSQRADVLVKAAYNKGYDEAVEFIEATNYLEANIKSAVEAAIEATKEKAAKVCDGMSIKYCKSAVAMECAAAIRSMK